MPDDIKPKIKIIYSELKGYLSQTPMSQQTSDIFANDSSWQQYNEAINELSQITGENYNRFIIKPEHINGHNIVHIVSFRQALGGIINRIHETFFPDETPPFSGTPQTIISQSQSQSVSIQMLLDFQSKIEKEINHAKGDPKKEGFLKRCKDNLRHVKDVNDLLKLVIETAKQFGLSVADLVALFT